MFVANRFRNVRQLDLPLFCAPPCAKLINNQSLSYISIHNDAPNAVSPAQLMDKTSLWHEYGRITSYSSRTMAEVCIHSGSIPLLCTLAHSSWFSVCSKAYCRRSSTMSTDDASTSSTLALSDSLAVFNDVMYSQAFARTAHLLWHQHTTRQSNHSV